MDIKSMKNDTNNDKYIKALRLSGTLYFKIGVMMNKIDVQNIACFSLCMTEILACKVFPCNSLHCAALETGITPLKRSSVNSSILCDLFPDLTSHHMATGPGSK